MQVASLRESWKRLWAARFEDDTARLRFALGEGQDALVPRFLQAHRRASTIADSVFGGTCFAIAAWNGFPPNSIGLQEDVADGFTALHATGFDAPHVATWHENLYADMEDEVDPWEVRAYDLGTSKALRDTLLWHAVALELPVSPSVPLILFLHDPKAALLLHAYDDRGMDVIAEDAERLRGLHATFSDWLLDEDRTRMAARF
ncbi:DUF3885 domain-containing protein [uncultured Sphingomonas sp.]|uniref:DUF3885 domain-containing protein n=1 Tax=uncultured Sphingomonas sp. TaxID=158754 RepID=UPI0025D9E6BC|nr:DUF3885 domain-containing protein [uncultured Sphingomonas sp.]